MIHQAILHYRIVRMLGSGGMGVVYEALDLKLDRLVALKFLPAELAADDAALERFQREARAASALNHPAICTIYAFEQAHTEDGLRHFLAMERLEGQSLDRVIAGLPLPTDVALEIAVQVADALDAAHTRGIIHRDIKPANVFVLAHNRVKVLDFGLAKLASARVGVTETMTADPGDRLTGPGAALGTVAYMSPEQARGDELDARTDLFSFGALLYEMCTGRTPFGGKTSAVIFEKILGKAPEPPRTLNAALPPRLEEIVMKALEKNRDLRCQTAAELRADLKRLQHDGDSDRRTSPEPPEDTAPAAPDDHVPAAAPISSGAVLVSEARRHKLALGIAAAAALLLLVAAGFGIYQWLTGGRRSVAPGQTMTMRKLTGSGQVTGCVSVSPDGQRVVYCERDAQLGRDVLRMLQVATGATMTISDTTGLPTFSPDGNLVYLRRSDGVLVVMPAFGGGEEPRRVLADVGGRVALSPDGDQIAFVRNLPPSSDGRAEQQVVIAKRDGTEPRVVIRNPLGIPRVHPSSLAWSPDGRVIAAGLLSREHGMLMSPVLIDVATGKVDRLTDAVWRFVRRTAWLRDGSGLVISGAEADGTQGQLWLVSHPRGEVQRITNDLHHYEPLDFDVDGAGTIVARQVVSRANVWISDAQGGGLAQLTKGSSFDSVLGWTEDGRILYLTDAPEKSVWSVSFDGAAPKRLPTDARDMYAIAYAPGQKWLAYMTEPVMNIWRVNLDGSDRRQLTHTGFDRFPRVAAGGAEILYENRSGGGPSLWKIPSSGGQAVRLLERAAARPLALSPDGKHFWVPIMEDEMNEPRTLGIFRASDGTLERTIDDSRVMRWVWNPLAQWSHDGASIVFRRSSAGIHNLWSQRLDGGEPQQLTRFESDSIFSFAFSPDGQRMATSRGTTTGDIVLIKNYR